MILASLPTSKDHVPSDIVVNIGCIDLPNRQVNVFVFPAKKTMAAAREFSERFCALANELVMETDYQLKTSYGDAERLLELLVLHLAQEARND